MKAIETSYAGCRFRSRLEARWAVVLDHLGITWEYEPQGFELEWRLHIDNAPLRYLPDFWLPGHQVWLEVKGELDEEATIRLLNIAASLTEQSGHDLVVLGPVPRNRTLPLRFSMYKGDLEAMPWDPTGQWRGGDPLVLGRDTGAGFLRHLDLTWQDARRSLLGGWVTGLPNPRLDAALAAGREASFEFGGAQVAERAAKAAAPRSGSQVAAEARAVLAGKLYTAPRATR